MTKKSLFSILLCAFVGLMFSTGLAQDIYVKNKAYKGTVVGSGMTAEISLEELSKGLGLEFEEVNGFWQLGEYKIPGRKQDGEILVSLMDLKNAGLWVHHSPELGTIDVAVPKRKGTATARKGQPAGEWGGSKPTLVYFGANW